MALRDQPYLPLYIQDIMTDEKLNECSAATHGIYIKGIMCLMHKSDTYGKLLLKQKHKQTSSKENNFALLLAKHLPYTVDEIQLAITELIAEKVCYYEDDYLVQKRMVKDNEISEKRALAGKSGGKTTQNNILKTDDFAKANSEANVQANSEYEYDNKTIIDIVDYLNLKSGKKFKHNTEKTKGIVKARLNEKYTEADFKKVIDTKCSKWLNDPAMADFLRPETLFGTKFESYLNESTVQQSQKSKFQF